MKKEPNQIDWPSLMTLAVGDIAAALILAGMNDKVELWINEYCNAINEADASILAGASVEAKLCGHCGAEYMLMGSWFLDRLTAKLDELGAPKWSSDRKILLDIIGRIEAVAIAQPDAAAAAREAD